VTNLSFTCGTSSITDNEGNSYNTVLIGTQCWTKENLKVTKYNDGTNLNSDFTGIFGGPNNNTGRSMIWEMFKIGAYAIYENQASTGINASTYGFLYNWFAAKGIVTVGSTVYKNICPTGWHVPTDTEWNTLIDFLGGVSVAGDKMKSKDQLWTTPNTNSNSSGFSALPSGRRNQDGDFKNKGDYATFWSSTEKDPNSDYTWVRELDFDKTTVRRFDPRKNIGYSVRCIKDQVVAQ
jgi:uncharacterized protein (TIGR02145 family)